MAELPISPRKRLAMGHEPRQDPRSGGMVIPRPGKATIKNDEEPTKHATKVLGSDKPDLESRAGVDHKGTDKGRRVGVAKGRP